MSTPISVYNILNSYRERELHLDLQRYLDSMLYAWFDNLSGIYDLQALRDAIALNIEVFTPDYKDCIDTIHVGESFTLRHPSTITEYLSFLFNPNKKYYGLEIRYRMKWSSEFRYYTFVLKLDSKRTKL